MNPVLMTVWAVLSACFLALLVYRGQIARYEDDQLFLSEESSTNEMALQESVVRRLKQIDPLVRIFGGAAGLATMGAVGIYVWDAWQKIQS
jgi:hypothetical protein